VRIGNALLQTEQRLQVRIGEEQLPEGHQLGRLAQLGRNRMNEIRNQTRAAVVSLWHFIKFNQIQSKVALKIN
jgi:hypothetical protein